jgi:hypothetical protein
MLRAPVSSSSIASVGYDRGQEVLEVEFRSGAVYRYYSVPRSLVRSLLDAPSKGAFLNRNIRNRYIYARV